MKKTTLKFSEGSNVGGNLKKHLESLWTKK